MIVRPTRRDVLRYGSAAALAALPAPAIAQSWPSKPIRIIEKAFQVRGWVGCAAPAGTPDDVVHRLSDLMVEAGRTERIQKIIDTFGIDAAARDRTYFKKVLDEEGPVWLEVIKSLNIEPQ